MGIEHREVEEKESQRCPVCEHVSVLRVIDGRDSYFWCQNPQCKVERIYGDNAVLEGE